MSLHQQETLQEGDPVEKLGQRHLLLPGGAAEVREHCPQACGAADRQVESSPSGAWLTPLLLLCFTLCRVSQGDPQLLPIVQDLLLSLQGGTLGFDEVLRHLPGGVQLLSDTR